LPFLRYVAAAPKPHHVIYMGAGECVNRFVFQVLINTNTAHGNNEAEIWI
jgi:hypothetical protein